MTINKTKIKFRKVCVKILIYNSKQLTKVNKNGIIPKKKLCGTIQNSGRYNEICYNKSDIFGVMVDFTFTGVSVLFFFS